MRVELHYFEDCPNWRTAEARLRALQAERGFELRLRCLSTDEEARLLRFRGSPTILVDGVDAFPDAPEVGALSCRLFSTPGGLTGVPTDDQLRQVLGA